MDQQSFNHLLSSHFQQHGRDLPWRSPALKTDSHGRLNGCAVLVSELMLQQTQVSRVEVKFLQFLNLFPTLKSLADAPFTAVLAAWQGLGYNRRALYLHEAAKVLVDHPEPWSFELLAAQKGIGKNTAAAVIVYAYNQPMAFVETNIRTVFIHHFFQSHKTVSDTQLTDIVQKMLPETDPRQWYWSLMDYGSFLKQTTKDAARKSVSYKKQSQFKGSFRALRAQVLRSLLQGPKNPQQIKRELKDDRAMQVLHALEKDGLIIKENNQFIIAR